MQTQSVDVLIVGAGVSGIGVAYYLQRDHPARSYVIVEAREASGGTWDLFRYPGVRSDSDLHTFGYEFRPWRSDVAIADAPGILAYLRATAAEYGIDARVRYRTRVVSAAWSSADARWTVETEVVPPDGGEPGPRATLTCRWLVCAAGYYRYDTGYTPDFPGRERFRGTVVHPQHWPDGLDYAGQRVVVIGSGATAVTVVPAMAGTAAHVTMVQRTPSYVLPVPGRDAVNRRLTGLLGPDRAYRLTRGKNIVQQELLWRFCRIRPRAARALIRRLNAAMLPGDFPVDEHFNPPYDPWDQRMCLAADADLFRAIGSGAASVVTGAVSEFTETGVRLADGREVPADLIVTATGLNLQALGGIALTVDGRPVRPADTVAYKGTMLTGVPNFCFIIGYANASWTLRVGLLGQYLTRLLSYMDERGYDTVTPAGPAPGAPTRPLLNLSSGYLRRAEGELPRAGTSGPWRTASTYHADARLLRRPPAGEAGLAFSRSQQKAGAGAGR